MRTFTFKGLFLTVLFVLLGSLAIQAADDGLITEQITIKLDKAGTLPDKISANEKNLITNLKIVGKINGTDLKFIREMAGRDFNGEKTDGKLSILDLSEAKIVAGGDAYFQSSKNYYTSNDKLGNYVFFGCSGLTSLTIPSGVTSIGGAAFRGCSGLTNLTIPSSVTSIGNYAFSGCSGLTSLTIPSGVTSIGKSAFLGCSGLTSLTIPSSVTSISDRAFYGCSGLTSIYACLEKIPTLGSNVFTGCDAKNCILYVPKGTIDDYLVSEFGYFKNIVDDGLLTTQVTIKLDEAGTLPYKISANEKNLITNLKIVGKINGTDLKFIREMAGRDFNGEKTDGKLSILDLSEAKIVAGGDAYAQYGNTYTSNDKLGDYAFYRCSRLTNLILPSSVTEIGWGAFDGCSGLTSLTLPSGVTSIGNYVFFGCSGLTSLTLPSSVTSIGEYAFYGCSGLTSVNIPSGVTSIGWGTFQGCSGLTSLSIPSSVTKIGRFAFYGCSGLTSLTIPSSVTKIDCWGVFYGCSGLTSLTLPSCVTSIGWGVFYGCSRLTSLTIPSSVTKIGESAFQGCSGLTSLTIPSSVTSIGKNAFNGCSGLTSLTLPSSVTGIGWYAFKGCSRLTSLTIPSSVTWIGLEAFSGCSGLTSIYVYTKKLPELGPDVFTGCNAQNCTVYVPTGTSDAYKSSEFGYFEKIVEFDATGIDKVTTSTNAKEVSRYSANGQRLSAPAKGLNIVKYSDGSVKKVVVQ